VLANAIRFGGLVSLALLLSGCTLTDLLAPAEGDGDAGSGAPPPTEAPAGPVESGLLQVGSVEVLILESFPVQVNVVVRGTLSDACTELGEIAQARSDNAIEVTITTVRDPLAICAQVLAPVEVTISLTGDFPPGEYTVTVNGVTEAFTV
jgi:inhibitor of cysteine peptidase